MATQNFTLSPGGTTNLYGINAESFVCNTSGLITVTGSTSLTLVCQAGQTYALDVNLTPFGTSTANGSAGGTIICTERTSEVVLPSALATLGVAYGPTGRLRDIVARAEGNNASERPVQANTDHIPTTMAGDATNANGWTLFPIASGLTLTNNDYRLGGGIPTLASGVPGKVYVSSVTQGSVAGGASGGNIANFGLGRTMYWSTIEFEFDGAAFDFDSFGAISYRMIVEGQYISLTPTTFSAGSGVNSFGHVVFPNAQPRRIKLELAGSSPFGGIRTNGTVVKPSNINDFSLAIITDSYGAGQGLTTPLFSYPRMQGELMGVQSIANAIGGTGYQQEGASALWNLQADGRFADVINQNADALQIDLGYNDQSFLSATQTAAVLSILTRLRATPQYALTTGKPIMIGGAWTGASATLSAVQAIEIAAQSAVTQFNDPLVFFAPVSTALSKPPIWGTGKIGTTTGVGPSDTATQSDGVHPTFPDGTQRLAIAKRAAWSTWLHTLLR